MNTPSKIFFRILMLSLVVVLFQACSLKIPISDPKISETSYLASAKSEKLEVQFQSKLNKNHSVATGDKTNIFVLQHNGEEIKANGYIKSALEKEFLAREIALNFNDSNNKLILEDFEILTHRVSGFSPLLTVSTLKIKINKDGKDKIFISMIKRGKLPVWTMSEVFEPCYNEATTLLIREVVAKINRSYFGNKFSDKYIEQLENRIRTNKNAKQTYMDVYELGFSNNLKSIDFLKILINSSDEYIRMAAISSIGTLGDSNQFDYLVSLNIKSESWQDKAMALKSIGDLDIQKGYDYLKERRDFWQGKSTKEAIWSLKVINLYLE